MKILTAFFVLSLAFGTCVQAEQAGASDAAKKKPVYLVSKYDPQRDPAKDLADAIKLASKQNRHIILQVGGDWCGWCSTLSNYFNQTDSVRDVLMKNYVVTKINVSNENKNKEFLSGYPREQRWLQLCKWQKRLRRAARFWSCFPIRVNAT